MSDHLWINTFGVSIRRANANFRIADTNQLTAQRGLLGEGIGDKVVCPKRNNVRIFTTRAQHGHARTAVYHWFTALVPR